MPEIFWRRVDARESVVVSEDDPLPVVARAPDRATVSTQTLAPTSASAVAIALIQGAAPSYAYLGPVETGQVRYWIGGAEPTTTVGHLLQIGDTLEIMGLSDILSFRVIAVSTTAAIPCTLEVED